MPFTGNADLDTIFDGMAAWEQSELVSHHADFHAYSDVPSQAELDAGLKYPHTLHVPVSSVPRIASLDATAPEVFFEHTFHTYLVLGKQVNDLSALQTRSGQWVLYYVQGMLKHRTLLNVLVAPNNGSLISQDAVILASEFWVGNLFGMDVVADRIAIKVTTRHTMAASR